jgi:hypothetical protein
MKIDLILKAIGQTLAALFFSLLELAWQVLYQLIKWALVAIFLAVKATVFILLLPISAYKCAVRMARHRSFAAGGQLAKWIWIDYWKTTRI